MKTSALLVAASIFGSWSGVGLAQATTALNAEATKMNTLASSQGDSKVVDKISSDFSSFLGGHSSYDRSKKWHPDYINEQCADRHNRSADHRDNNHQSTNRKDGAW